MRNGDGSAFEKIYKTYASGLFQFCRKNIPNKEDCEEIIQEVFVSLWERHENLNITSLKQYLFTAVRYKIIRYFSHNAIKRKYELHYRFFESIYDTMPDEPREAEQLQTRIASCLADMPQRAAKRPLD